jgi:hypothetical protein
MRKDLVSVQRLLPYEAPSLRRFELSQPLNLLVNFSIEMDFDDLEEEEDF